MEIDEKRFNALRKKHDLLTLPGVQLLCEAYEERHVRNRAIIDALPRTADGVLIEIGMTLYWTAGSCDAVIESREVSSIMTEEINYFVFYCTGDGTTYAMPVEFGLYSTRTAAEAAKEQP